MGRVIEELAHETGIRVHYSVLPEEPVTASCAGTTLRPILECLLGNEADLMFRYPEGFAKDGLSKQPSDVWVLASSFEGAGGRVVAGVPDDVARRPMEAARAGEEDTDALLARAGGKNPVERVKAIGRLIVDKSVDEALLRAALEKALADEDAEVRAQAVYGLSQRGGDGYPDLLRSALSDRDASVRLMAVDSAGSDALGLAVLREALADRDETVRVLASAKLEAAEGGLSPSDGSIGRGVFHERRIGLE